MIVKILALILLAAFYISYIVKLLMLRRQNIQADILGKGEKPKGRAILEIALKCVTYLGAAVKFSSVIFDGYIRSFPTLPTMREGGLILMALGVIVFIAAISAMQNNWRAGYSKEQNTELVTGGIYRYSRNPAFAGFDLLYIGCALAFPNPANIAVTIAAVTLFHIQILGEEKFLAGTFGQEYQNYKARTMRYLGIRKECSCKF